VFRNVTGSKRYVLKCGENKKTKNEKQSNPLYGKEVNGFLC
jgi:hypothetical protein